MEPGFTEDHSRAPVQDREEPGLTEDWSPSCVWSGARPQCRMETCLREAKSGIKEDQSWASEKQSQVSGRIRGEP